MYGGPAKVPQLREIVYRLIAACSYRGLSLVDQGADRQGLDLNFSLRRVKSTAYQISLRRFVSIKR
jgi:hypothetical protein